MVPVNINMLTLNPKAHDATIVQGNHYRFTVLTEQLIRIEYSEHGVFEDRATQSIINRNFPIPEFEVIRKEDSLEIITKHFHLYYSYGPFSKSSLRIDVKNNYSLYSNRWYYGDSFETLKGTVRTLDHLDGAVELEEGIQSHNGFSVIDDSKSNILVDEETIEPRAKDQVDFYFFAYGREYKEALRDFYKLTGVTPLLPRYALGNWWSRYWKYTETEYKELFQRFQKEDVPFSLSVIDMDWHLVDIPAKYGSGWTGYTWNKELFPDPTRFLEWLQEQELRVTLNVHPADGVRAHEEMYVPMAKELGIDYNAEHPISFDITDKKFRDAYFKYLHRPEEERGVSFWWLDWQQGTTTKVAGLDPLWLLNHYHALDQVKQGKRPLILSRYAGIGSHRYPVGFSGDTIITWDSLRFQPYFTSTATNVGYTWWSHDIGGHYKGYKDDELSLRWMQFGVFSPIMRLHSTNSPFNGKEPWRFQEGIGGIMKQYLRLRHELIPYLYTMNWRTHQNNHPLIMPMYYEYPMETNAYDAPHQYFFGSELIVIPVTEKLDSDLQKAPVDVWLPEGQWIDFFSGRVYKGGKKLRVFRGLDTIPVFAKEGAIVPMAKHVPHSNSVDNPTALSIHVFPGKSNTFELYEDDGESFAYQTGKYAVTKMQLDWENQKFVFFPAEGDCSVIPENRELNISFKGFTDMKKIAVHMNGKEIDFVDNYDSETNTCTVKIMNYDTRSILEVMLLDEVLIQEINQYEAAIFDLLDKAQISFELKDKLYQLIKQDKNKFDLLIELRTMKIDENLYDAIVENLID